MGLIGIPDHHVPQFIHLNVECKLLEQDRMAKQRDLVIGFELGFAWWLWNKSDTHGYTAVAYAIIASEMQPQNACLKVSIVVTVGLFYQNYIWKSEPPLVTSPGQPSY